MLFQSPTIIRVPRKNNFFAYIEGLDSMGLSSAEKIVQAIKRTGNKQKYTHAHEWCCGHGAMGFELLFENLCEHLTLTDAQWLASISCEFVRVANRLEDVCDIYLIDTIDSIPMPKHKWDLVIANPPYAPSDEYYLAKQWIGPEQPNEQWYVQMIDDNWRAHKNFFQNVTDYATRDCDIYLFGSTVWLDQQISIAESYQYKIIGIYDDLVPIAQTVKLLHFRHQNSSNQ